MVLSTISTHWNHTSWLTGYSPVYMSPGTCPNSGAMFRLMVLGEIEVHAFPATAVLEAFKKIGDGAKHFDDLKKKLISLEEAKYQSLITTGGLTVWHHKQEKDQLIYIPVGWVVIERVVSGPKVPSVYAVRKSYFFDTPASQASYNAVVKSMQDAGREVKKMSEVSALFKSMEVAQ